MNVSDQISLTKPDGIRQALETLPMSRADAIHITQQACTGFGTYTFVREVTDPLCGEMDLTEVVVSAYDSGQFGITQLASDSTITATSHDITLYLLDVVENSRNMPLQLSLDVYEDTPDCEYGLAWLCFEDSSGHSIAEFGLEVRDRLSLPVRSKPMSKPVFLCDLPTFRSAFRFVSIACDAFCCSNVRIRSFPINLRSVDWFA